MAYLLDADVFIRAKNLHYGLDFCPAFWEWLIDRNAAGSVFSIEKVGDEVQAIEDDLSTWAADRGPGFFLPPGTNDLASLAAVSAWAGSHHYEPSAVSTFLQVADYYLVAQAHAGKHIIVTHEIPSASTRRIKIPDACIGLASSACHRSRCSGSSAPGSSWVPNRTTEGCWRRSSGAIEMTQPLSRRGFSVRVFLPGGDPDGIKVVEKSNWTGCGLVVPRALFGEAKGRPELDRAGVYVLVGQSELSPLPQVYVGEGDPVRPRLEQHAKLKDFWTHAVVFTSKDQNLNKAHVQRLEARLVELARASKRCVLDNGNVPQAPSLSEADTAEVEGFLADMLLCLPIIGYGFFESTPAVAPKAVALVLRAKGIVAYGFESPKGFVVQAGSKAVKQDREAPSIHAYLKETRAELVRQGVLVDRGASYELAQDYAFSSPSMASGVLLGRSSNGRVEWQTADGRTLKSLQDAEMGA